ncbi:VWA domain-containing protein [Candidatus Woesearchaeota archaeon]|nr:MAG: VWA domain-containing protein [Candidatus Woesearchaeota archaeon]
MVQIVFAKPVFLWLFGIIPLMIFIHFYSLKRGKKRALRFANYEAIRRITGEQVVTKNILLLLMRTITVVFLIFSAAGIGVWYMGNATKFDMVIAMDASSSMLAEDYSPNRLEAAKAAMTVFAKSVPGNIRIGLVTFSGASFIKLKPTDDMDKVVDTISKIEIEKLGGTDLGQAIITAANLMPKEGPRVVVLLTDGQDNIGITPDEALEYIKDDKIVVHTIGMGSKQGGPIGDIAASFTVDEDTLKHIAQSTNGNFFMPTDEESLKNTFLSIAQFRNSPLKKDLSIYFLSIAIFFLLIEWGLLGTKYSII